MQERRSPSADNSVWTSNSDNGMLWGVSLRNRETDVQRQNRAHRAWLRRRHGFGASRPTRLQRRECCGDPPSPRLSRDKTAVVDRRYRGDNRVREFSGREGRENMRFCETNPNLFRGKTGLKWLQRRWKRRKNWVRQFGFVFHKTELINLRDGGRMRKV